MPLSHEVVLVTGASGNLGGAVVRLLLRRGARVVAVDRSDASSMEDADPARLLHLKGYDLAQKTRADGAVAEAVAQFGRVSALINTIGGFQMSRVADDALGQWDAMMGVNARAALVISAAILPALVGNGRGSIVHIAAQPGLKAGAGQAAYAASKAALLRLTEAIAAEHRADRITANCILPGTIDTPSNRAAMPDAKPDTFVPPDAIAELAAFLVSPEAAVVTGGAIPATGLARRKGD